MDKGQRPLLPLNEGNKDGGGFSWLTAIGFGFLTFNSALAIYRSRGDMASVAFVAASYPLLVLLFYFLRQLERGTGQLDSPGPRGGRLAIAVWTLATATTVSIVCGPKEAMDPGSTSFIVSVMLAFMALLGAQALLLMEMNKICRG